MDYSEKNYKDGFYEKGHRLTWEDVYPDSEQRESAQFGARYFRELEVKLRKEKEKLAFFATKTLK